MTRIAYITQCPFISGAERSLQTMLLHSSEAGIEPVVFCPPGVEMVAWCGANGVPTCTCTLAYRDKWHPIRWWCSVRTLTGLFRQRQIDVVHANQIWAYPAAGTAGHALGLPRVCHMRDEVASEAIAWCCRSGVEMVLSISRHIHDQVAAAWPTSVARPTIETLIDPVEMPERLSPQEQTRVRLSARRQFDVAADKIVLGFIGQIIPPKGVLELLDALAAMDATRQWHLLIAGRDPRPGARYEAACRAKVRELGMADRVTFLGYLDDVGSFYETVDLVLVPSLEEPLGRIPLEAASHGKPSVAFATGGLPETIEDGKTGWLVPTGDIQRLTGTIRRFVETPTSETGNAARDWVESMAAPDTYMQRLAALYERLQ